MPFRPKLWIVVDVILYTILLSLSLTLGGGSLVTPMMSPVSCTDPNLQHSLRADTFPIELVVALCLVLPAITIFVMELVLDATDLREPRGLPMPGCVKMFTTAFCRTMPYAWDLLVGELFAYCLMELLKITTGMPRPHFWDSCGNKMKDDLCQKNGFVIVDLHKCPNPHGLKHRHLMDAAKSFPSGHSCLAVFSAVYMTAYIYQRLRPPDSSATGGSCRRVALKWLPLPWFVTACLISTSRLWDQRHHWWDLVGGSILGALMAMLTVVTISRGFRRISKSTPLNREGDRDRELVPLNGGASPEAPSP